MKVNIFTVTHFDNPAPKHQGGYVAFGFQQNLHSLWICSPFGHATALLVHLCAELSATFHLLVAESSFWFWLLHELLDILLERLHGPLAKVKPPYFQSCYISNISFCKPQLIPHAVKRTPDAVSNVLCCLSWPAECPHVFQFVHMDVGVLWQWKDGFKQKKNRRTWRCMFSTNDVEKALCPVHIACRLFPEAWRNRDIWQIEPCKSICESMCRQRMIEWIWQALETLRVWVRWHEYGCSRLNVATSRQMQHSL